MTSLPAGRLDKRVRFERQSVGKDRYGAGTGAWAEHATVWAWVVHGTGQERREAAQEDASAAATFRVRRSGATLALSEADRLRFDPLGNGGSAGLDAAPVWDIISVVPIGRDAIEVAAVRSRNA